MNVLFNLMSQWWRELTLSGVFVAACTFLWKKRETVLEYVMFVWNFKKRFEETERAVKNPISSDAKFCPNCDGRMRVVDRGFGYWMYRCAKCNERFPYPAPGSNK